MIKSIFINKIPLNYSKYKITKRQKQKGRNNKERNLLMREET